MKPQLTSGNTDKLGDRKPNLGALYKPVGIQAITAAAICKRLAAKRLTAAK